MVDEIMIGYFESFSNQDDIKEYTTETPIINYRIFYATTVIVIRTRFIANFTMVIYTEIKTIEMNSIIVYMRIFDSIVKIGNTVVTLSFIRLR